MTVCQQTKTKIGKCWLYSLFKIIFIHFVYFCKLFHGPSMRESSQSPLDDSHLLDPAPKNVQFIAFSIALLLDVKIASSGGKTAVCISYKRHKNLVCGCSQKLKLSFFTPFGLNAKNSKSNFQKINRKHMVCLFGCPKLKIKTICSCTLLPERKI